MKLLDVNIYVNAFRSEMNEHKRCKAFIEECYIKDLLVGLSPQALSGMVRIVTHPKIFKEPSRLDETLEYCQVLFEHPRSNFIFSNSQQWSVFEKLCKETNARGNLVPDAYFAALAIEFDCEWITLDHDFARFPGLKWRLP